MSDILRACARGIMSHATDCISGAILAVLSVIVSAVAVGPSVAFPVFEIGGVAFLILFIGKVLWS